MPDRLILKPEVLERVGVTFGTIWTWMRDGRFPLARQLGGKTVWYESEVDEWLKSRPFKKYKPLDAPKHPYNRRKRKAAAREGSRT